MVNKKLEAKIDKLCRKAMNRVLFISKKDKRIRELWDALNHAHSIMEAYGHMEWYEANPEWEKPVYLRNGEYTMEKRLEDIRHKSEQITKCSEEIQKVLFNGDPIR